MNELTVGAEYTLTPGYWAISGAPRVRLLNVHDTIVAVRVLSGLWKGVTVHIYRGFLEAK
jgi:hypothetical protein